MRTAIAEAPGPNPLGRSLIRLARQSQRIEGDDDAPACRRYRRSALSRSHGHPEAARGSTLAHHHPTAFMVSLRGFLYVR